MNLKINSKLRLKINFKTNLKIQTRTIRFWNLQICFLNNAIIYSVLKFNPITIKAAGWSEVVYLYNFMYDIKYTMKTK